VKSKFKILLIISIILNVLLLSFLLTKNKYDVNNDGVVDIVDGYTGTVDFRIVGKRVNEEHRYFEIMGGFEHGVAEEVNI